jgi:hypothetical protein
LKVWPWRRSSRPSCKQQPPQNIPPLFHQNFQQHSVTCSPITTGSLNRNTRIIHTRHNVSQPKNSRRKPHPQHISTVYGPNFGLQDTAVVALACAACSVNSEHERYGEPFAHDRGPGRGYAGSWRIRWWHVSHKTLAEGWTSWRVGVRLTKLEHRFMAASKVLGEETVNGAAGPAADASQNKRS